MTQAHLKALEDEIAQLTRRRALLFQEWAVLVKRNEIDFEFYGKSSPSKIQKAQDLLQEQRYISRKIMKILKRVNNLHIVVK